MHTHTVNTSARALKSRGALAILFDVYSPQRWKPRLKAGAFAARQASREPILIRGIAGDVIGAADAATLREIPGLGLYVQGALSTERQEALDTLRSIRADRIRVEYPDELHELTLHPKAEAAPQTKVSYADELAEIAHIAEHIAEDTDNPVDPRDVLELQVELGLKYPAALERYDQTTGWRNRPAPTKPLGELRAETARVERECAASSPSA